MSDHDICSMCGLERTEHLGLVKCPFPFKSVFSDPPTLIAPQQPQAQKIKFGDIEYFTLLDLRDKLKYFQYDKLDLVHLDRLRSEVEIKIERINLVAKNTQPKQL